ncbi:MAG: tRNA pseudouridine(55) synthase TruB [Proteobacteria bacterium]|nr:MAG: tRNA pseudouridine(55) synthase TruB [Pseudomonadota bacterium]QKK12218.1 MAG: tRNA pseudouridine(55) synthase TruB [Pseudomonadota bacterium]
MPPRNGQRRNVHGVLLLDKPVGPTSNRALQMVKRLFNARKAGHTGSLDPLASGLLPICLGEATKFSGFLLDADKRYWVRMKLGETTTTGDADGELITTKPVPSLDFDSLSQVMGDFLGAIEQIPPMYSALRHEGKRLYELARKGEEVERKPRVVTIHALELLRVENTEAEFTVHCSKGTYVRTLVEDIGARLGCGAHVIALRRIGVGPYPGDGMVTLEELQASAEAGEQALDALLLPIESSVQQWPEVQLSADSAYYLQMGQPVMVPRAPTSGWVRIYTAARRFIGVGEVLDDGRIAPRRMLQKNGS